MLASQGGSFYRAMLTGCEPTCSFESLSNSKWVARCISPVLVVVVFVGDHLLPPPATAVAVSGVMCVARTSKAAARLSASFRTREGGVEKIYHAVVAGELSGSGTRRDLLVSPDESGPVARRGRGPRTAVAPTRREDGGGGGDHGGRGAAGSGPSEKLAELEWEVVGVSPSAAAGLRCSLTGERRTLVRLRLVTGRKHQIRVQLAEMGHPVVGDTRYGVARSSARRRAGRGADGATLPPGAAEMTTTRPLEDRSILLHASELSLPHPTRVGTTVRAVAPPPEVWSDICGRKVIEEVFGSL